MNRLTDYALTRNHESLVDSLNEFQAIADRHEALQAYIAYEHGVLAEIPGANDAHVRSRSFGLE